MAEIKETKLFSRATEILNNIWVLGFFGFKTYEQFMVCVPWDLF